MLELQFLKQNTRLSRARCWLSRKLIHYNITAFGLAESTIWGMKCGEEDKEDRNFFRTMRESVLQDA